MFIGFARRRKETGGWGAGWGMGDRLMEAVDAPRRVDRDVSTLATESEECPEHPMRGVTIAPKAASITTSGITNWPNAPRLHSEGPNRHALPASLARRRISHILAPSVVERARKSCHVNPPSQHFHFAGGIHGPPRHPAEHRGIGQKRAWQA